MASAYNGDLAGFAQIIGGLCPLSRPHGLRVISLTNKQTDTHTQTDAIENNATFVKHYRCTDTKYNT